MYSHNGACLLAFSAAAWLSLQHPVFRPSWHGDLMQLQLHQVVLDSFLQVLMYCEGITEHRAEQNHTGKWLGVLCGKKTFNFVIIIQ